MRHLPLLILALLLGCGRAVPLPESTPLPALQLEKVEPPEPAPASPSETIDNPSYKLWANFPVGTIVTQQTKTFNPDKAGQTVTDITYNIKEKSDRELVLETQATTTYPDGRVQANPASEFRYNRTLTLPPGVKRIAPEKNETRETLTILGKSFECRKVVAKNFTDAGDMQTETWSSESMPGGLVRSVSVVPKVNVTSTVEVTALKMP